MKKYIQLALPTLAILSGCTSLQEKEQKEFEETMARMNQVCTSCSTVYTDIVKLKVDQCEITPMVAFNESKESPVVLSMLGLYSMNPIGYKAYLLASERTINCSNEQKWADDISDFLSTKVFKDYYLELMKEEHLTNYDTEDKEQLHEQTL
ncbi:hypothetical protein [Vibrio sp. 10N.239.312.D08]|uniref:hypothetical protein n=1 Tax=Vibrio sp. 10N.239.312.D08 TaxID=3229978 RepID=UPI0035532B5D